MYSHFQQSHPSKPCKKRLTKEQVRLLENSFSSNQKLKADLKLELARQLGLPPKQIAVWYQNRRARHKTHAIEHDYRSMHQELDSVMAQNDRLEKEVEMLKHELTKAQQMLLLVSTPSSAATHPSMSASSGDDHASSMSPANMIWRQDDGDVFPGEGLCGMMSWLNQ